MEEKLISVPLSAEAKDWLDERAAINHRATGREAQSIIEAARKRDRRRA